MPKTIGSLTLYNIDELSRTLGVTPLTLRAYAREGRIKARKAGGKWFFSEDALKAYFEGPHDHNSTKVKKERTWTGSSKN